MGVISESADVEDITPDLRIRPTNVEFWVCICEDCKGAAHLRMTDAGGTCVEVVLPAGELPDMIEGLVRLNSGAMTQ